MYSTSEKSIPANILIVEDDPDISEVLKLQLELKSHSTVQSPTIREAKELISLRDWDLILLDRMLPDAKGIDFCRYVRSHKEFMSIPIIFVTALGESEHIVEGLSAGADDYITKPFDIDVLHARVNSILRRTRKNDISNNDLFTLGELTLSPSKRKVYLNDNEISLTHSEFSILEQLFTHQGIVQTRENLISTILGDDIHVTHRTIDTHIAGLRKKLKNYSTLIETIRGVGYRLLEKLPNNHG